MSKGILYITNAQGARQLMKAGGIDGDVLAWEDQLYEGPVPAGLGPEDLVARRTAYFAEAGYTGELADSELFSERLRRLAGIMEYRQVIMLFEDGLKDQLLLIQLLDYLSAERMRSGFLKLFVVADDLGLMPVNEIMDCLRDAEAVTGAQLGVGRLAWRAFRADSPREFERLLRNQATAVLPYFRDNIRRMLQQYPWHGNGLNRTQHFILSTVLGGVTRPVNVYLACQEMEQAPFMNVSIFWNYLNELLGSTPPLLQFDQGRMLALPASLDQARAQNGVLSCTSAGKDMLNNRLNWLEMTELDRWFGGVHVNRENLWLWDEHDNQVMPAGVRG